MRVTLLNMATRSEKRRPHSFAPWPSNRCVMGRGRRTVGTDDMASLVLAARKIPPPSMASHFISTFLQKTSLALEIKLLSCRQINSPTRALVNQTRNKRHHCPINNQYRPTLQVKRPYYPSLMHGCHLPQITTNEQSGPIKKGARLPFISIWRYCTLRHWLKISSCWSYTAVFTSQIPSMDENRLSWE